MRFGILTQYYPPEIGAPQARLSELAACLIRRGHEVTVLTAMPNYPAGRIHQGYSGLLRRETMAGARVIRTAIYPTRALGARRLASYGSFVASSSALGLFALPRLDLLMTESPPLFLGFAGFFLSRMKQARWIFNVSDLWPESAVRLGAVRDGLALDLAWKLEAFCYRKAWLVSGQSREILDDVTRRFPRVPVWHLSNGAQPELFSPQARSVEARQKLGGGSCIALYAGLHGIAQGLNQILRAAEMLRDVGGLRIALIGEGPEKAALVRAARERGLSNVTFLDPVPRAQMPELLASADLALVPLKEHLPGAVPSKIYEAMAAGVPVVLAAQGEAADVIRRSSCGVAVAPNDAEALAGAVRELAANEPQRRAFGEAGLKAAWGEFNRRAILDRFISHLERSLPHAHLQRSRSAPQFHEDGADRYRNEETAVASDPGAHGAAL
jgi:glycosyltransferase involved in cell wall biosynthesis